MMVAFGGRCPEGGKCLVMVPCIAMYVNAAAAAAARLHAVAVVLCVAMTEAV